MALRCFQTDHKVNVAHVTAELLEQSVFVGVNSISISIQNIE